MTIWRDSRSYWQETGARPELKQTALPERARVAVVGAGLLGACAAYWLARAGADVLLLDRDGPAAGATGRNGGFMTVGTAESFPEATARLGHADARAIWDLTIASRTLVRQVVAEERIACDYREPGTLFLATDAAQLVDLRRTAAALEAEGFDGAAIDRQTAQEYVATPLGEQVCGGLFNQHGALLHSANFIYGMVAAGQRHGARLALTEVHRLASDGAGVALETVNGTLRADAAIVCANAWTGNLVPDLARAVRPVRGQMLGYAPLAPIFRCGTAADLTPTGEYWQQTPSGEILLGGCRAAATGKDEWVWEMTPTAEVQTALEAVLPQLFPQLGGLEVTRRWAGLMGFTPDYLPIADGVPGVAGAWVTGGFCGHGMPFGMRLGQLLAEAALSGTTPAALAPLRFKRPTLA